MHISTLLLMAAMCSGHFPSLFATLTIFWLFCDNNHLTKSFLPECTASCRVKSPRILGIQRSAFYHSDTKLLIQFGNTWRKKIWLFAAKVSLCIPINRAGFWNFCFLNFFTCTIILWCIASWLGFNVERSVKVFNGIVRKFVQS